MQIRYGGDRYDPFAEEDEEDDALMGVRMLRKMAEEVTHIYALGVNTTHIYFARK